jgi:hypothetical protein
MSLDNLYAQIGETPKLESIYAISHYDPENGKIFYIHHVLIMKGSSPMEPQRLEKHVVTLAEAIGQNVKGLEVLHTPDKQDMTSNYRVDVERKILINIPEPTQGTRD